MKYVGSKNRHAKEILPIILRDRQPNQWYVEPFVGGCNLIDKVDGLRWGNDYNPYLIAMWKALQQGWHPPIDVSEVEYQTIKSHKSDYPLELVAFVGIGCSFSGKWFGGYARGNDSKGNPRNYAKESHDNVMKQRDYLLGIRFTTHSFDELTVHSPSIIYCDPPYENTVDGYATGVINYHYFWDWCRVQRVLGHRIFVSSYDAPSDFTCVWSKEVLNTLDLNTGAKRGIEKLWQI